MSWRSIAMLVVGLLVAPDRVSAEWDPAGALEARGLLRAGTMVDPFRCNGGACERRDAGGGMLVDLWQEYGVLSIGAVTGLAFIGGADDETRVFTPLGVSASLRLSPERVGFALRTRLGMWAGATNPGFRVGPWASFGVRLEWALDPKLAVTLGFDVDLLFLHGTTTLFAPGVGLAWRGPS